MRAERLLRIVVLLQSRGRATAGELARELGVTARTIQRDMVAPVSYTHLTLPTIYSV